MNKSANTFTHHCSTENPIRAELYSVERLEDYAEYLASQLTVTHTPQKGQPVLSRVRENGVLLLKAYRDLNTAIHKKDTISPAAEWFTDNYYIVEDQLREIKEDLPPAFYKELPKLNKGELSGYPRVYALALALVAHTDSQLETEAIRRFIQAFQKTSPLQMSEIWALAITLRLVLVENLKRIVQRVAWDLEKVRLANQLADRLFETANDSEKFQPLVSQLPKACGENVSTDCAFVAQVTKRLRDQEPELWPALEGLEKHLSLQNTSTEELVHAAHQVQAANQVTVANIITSMRLLSGLNWSDFFESISLVDRVLERDPTADYPRMDFKTRDHYRHVIERFSKKTGVPEIRLAENIVQLASDSQFSNPHDNKKAHVGYYLIGPGTQQLEAKFHSPIRSPIWTWTFTHPNFIYFGLLGTFFAVICAVPIGYVVLQGGSWASLLSIALLISIPCSELALSATNTLITHRIRPRLLPKLDLTSGIPPNAKTIVIMPCMLCSASVIRDLLAKLEIHYLRNSVPQLYFALLTDFTDADSLSTPEDQELLQITQDGIANLNLRYPQPSGHTFFLFHRDRKWNAGEKLWMGWERKRGKIHEFNRLLRGAKDTTFQRVTAPLELLPQIRYVITLDADTQLPRDSARKLVGTILHPLNQPYFDTVEGRVTSGYAILQPRIGISLESSSRSLFSKLFSDYTGVDPYTTAVSDVYQDLFGEGSYTGKGLYDIDAFQAALKDKVPENTVLSHDLFEGLFARVALLTDIELLDDYPQTYRSSFERQHRWTRGDWQISNWILPKVRNERGEKVHNQLSLISKWKIFDNLRRSLVSPAICLWLTLAWIALPGSPVFWTSMILVIFLFPTFVHTLLGVGTQFTRRRRMIEWSGVLATHLLRATLQLLLVAHQAFIQVDAVLRVFFRRWVSKQNFLEWSPAAQSESLRAQAHPPVWKQDWPAESVLMGVVILLFSLGSRSSVLGVPLILLWMLYPVTARLISRARSNQQTLVTSADAGLLRHVARRTWYYFESFVGAEDNWLPVDNFQEDPFPVVAHRTSPTNMGLYLLSLSSARDLGYLSTSKFISQLQSTLNTMGKMEQYEGHYYNWYDTQTLLPLNPKYVSTVDSGNLAGYLLALKQTCLEIPNRPVVEAALLEGLKDTLSAIRYEAKQYSDRKTSEAVIGCLNPLHTLNSTPYSGGIKGWISHLRDVLKSLQALSGELSTIRDAHPSEHFESTLKWVSLDICKMGDAITHAKVLLPWVTDPDDSTASDFSRVPLPFNDLGPNPSLTNLLAAYTPAILTVQKKTLEIGSTHPDYPGLVRLSESLSLAQETLNHFFGEVCSTIESMERIFVGMNFKFLINPDRRMFSIGYNVTQSELDGGLYDLLASESRLAIFSAVAKGDAPQEQWFRLGRRLVPAGGNRALISWSASMFEYLMPNLVMRDYENTLLAETIHAVVESQIRYGKKKKIPWGVSEAGYNARDLQLNYQYGPFGIPGLGLKRGLSHDLVISPYSTFLAGMVQPLAALKNIGHLMNLKLLSTYGFYESVDYTPERLPANKTSSVIQSFMAHHQGMTLVAINNILNNNIMQDRFHTEPRVRATRLLLHERIPAGVTPILPKTAEVELEGDHRTGTYACTRSYGIPNDSSLHIQLLSNRTYSLMVSAAGAGYSKCKTLAVTRWKEDATRDHWGSFVFVRDLAEDLSWSGTYQPLIKLPQTYKAIFAEEKVEFLRTDGDTSTHTQILVAPEDNVEIRHVTLTNHAKEERIFEVTSYLEPVLSPAGADLDHLAFSKLFIQTEYWPLKSALLANRRKRSAEDSENWGLHVVVTDGEVISDIQYETDRARFIGRGRTLMNPVVLDQDESLSNTTGATLDPIFSLRLKVRIPAGGKTHFAFTTGLATTREQALEIADRYHDIHSFERERKLAWTKSQADLRHLNIDSETAYLFQRLAERIIYSESSLRPPSQKLETNTQVQSTLWPHGISGDLPILSVRITDRKELAVVRQLLRCHEYLRLKGLVYDFVILNEHKASYFQELQDLLQQQIRTTGSQDWLNKSGGVFILRCGLAPDTDSSLIQSLARVSLAADLPLKDQIDRKMPEEKYPPLLALTENPRAHQIPSIQMPPLAFFNGLGGFTQSGEEYVVVLRPGQLTPAPWINVVGNGHHFGFQISESGSGFTWSINSQANRLTPWSNDPVCDPSGEIIYLRDDETGEVWTPTPLPIREDAVYTIRHGQGYSTFEYVNHGLHHLLTVFVPKNDSIKISLLELKNLSNRKRTISVISYTEWVLGTQREKTAPHLICDIDSASGAIFARNPRDNEFFNRVAFAALSQTRGTFTCSRREFLGLHGNYVKPNALKRQGLSGKKGTGRDPCGVLQTTIVLGIGASSEIAILLGQTENETSARTLVLRYRDLKIVKAARDEVIHDWKTINRKIQVTTPDPALDILMNHWLIYQTLSCRFWSRTAFYQSGGAYGFRDQLQDCMALIYSAPHLTREQILRAAARQFPEGDVQHWWHSPSGRGIRTRISDDLLWLPFVVSFYIQVTGDRSILAEIIPFLDAPLLKPEQEDSYTTPTVSEEVASLFEHCKRAIDHSLSLGRHGLPLIGSGDWNDGMNRVGILGQGESVWLGWFLHKVITDFLPFCTSPEHSAFREKWISHQKKLKEALEDQGWDGQWYRRAFFDDGTPLGSAQNEECRIDSIAQSWSVLSGVGDPSRSSQAMAKLSELLVRPDSELILLLTPPFEKTVRDPGYIKGYVPGVRENGGQYTHAAVWAMMAFAKLGDGETAFRLFKMLNPVEHALTRPDADRYQIEPYVLAGDVYSGGALNGRGGWSWYTGSAAWYYRAGLESLLGLRVQGSQLKIEPCIPTTWKGFEIRYLHGTSRYTIEVKNPHSISVGNTQFELDGFVLPSSEIELVDDAKEHRLVVTLLPKEPVRVATQAQNGKKDEAHPQL